MKILDISNERMINLLDEFNLDELDSLDVLLSQAKSINIDIINKAFINVMIKKWDAHRSEYEGMNEYDNITRKINFDVTTIPDHVLNQYECVFFKKIMKDAIKNIKIDKNSTYLEIVPNIEEALKKINSSLNKKIDITSMISDEELKTMFNKFDVIEIKKLNKIFEFNEEYNTEKMLDIGNKVYEEKIDNRVLSHEEAVKEYSYYDIIDLSNKKNELNEEELELLSDIIDDSLQGLINYKRKYGLKQENYDKLETSLFNLSGVFSNELENRNPISIDDYDDEENYESYNDNNDYNHYNVKVLKHIKH